MTTPPGLYLVSNLMFAMTGLGCSLNNLRSTNVIFVLVKFLVLAMLVKRLQGRSSTHSAINMAIFPISYFYTFLYYTDSGSETLVLLAYLLTLKKAYAQSAIIGASSIWFRQTNVLWVAFTAAVALEQELKSCASPGVLVRIIDPTASLMSVVSSALPLTFSNLSTLLRKLSAYILTMVAFIIFIIYNGGVVLGDKSNHVAGLHVPQLFYFSCTAAAFLAPLLLSASVRAQIMFRIRQISYFVAVGQLVLSVYCIRNYTLEHPFILSDNRHLSFYVWKNIFRRHYLVRYILAPIYLITFNSLVSLQSQVTVIKKTAYALALVLTLIPSPLFEFRYFITPFILYRLHMRTPSSRILWAETVLYIAANAVVLFMFLYRPFEWPSEPGKLQRFMW